MVPPVFRWPLLALVTELLPAYGPGERTTCDRSRYAEVSTIRDPPQHVGQTAPATYPTNSAKTAIDANARPADRRGRFETILDSSKRQVTKRFLSHDRKQEPDGDRDCTQFAPVANLSLWFRPETPACVLGTSAIRPPLRLAPQQRILIASGHGTPQARIQIGAGQLAGSEIHLALAGTRIEAQVLTRNESSRQTLVAAMDAVREKLKARGRLVGKASTGDPGEGRDQNPWLREPKRGRGNAGG
jgi:hypothetical protein